MKWGVRYPISGVHECPFGEDQAQYICALAIGNGVDAVVVRGVAGEWV